MLDKQLIINLIFLLTFAIVAYAQYLQNKFNKIIHEEIKIIRGGLNG